MSMAMTWTLVKKDFLIAKRFALVVLAVGIVLPLFTTMTSPSVGTIGVFLFMTLYSELILGQYVISVENKYAKVEALLFASPYSRKSFVAAKYLFFLIVFAGCALIYSALSMIPAAGVLFGMDALLITLLVTSIIYGILLPVQLKLGVEKTRFLFLVILFSVTFCTPMVLPYLAQTDIARVSSLPKWLYDIGLIALSAICLGISALFSINVYEKKEF